jgi:hypothetical protein
MYRTCGSLALWTGSVIHRFRREVYLGLLVMSNAYAGFPTRFDRGSQMREVAMEYRYHTTVCAHTRCRK